MILFKKANELRNYLDQQVKKGKKTGFVPTMGALHQGHISLAETCKKENDLTIASIFVNPTQFNDPKDFEKYPITIEKDIQALEVAGCDVLFLPTVEEIYPPGMQARHHYDLGQLENILEGKFRPGHFQGVCMVVERLLNIVQPHHLYLGQKDYQQCMVINKLIELMGAASNIKVVVCPTLREADGLAMSSRNVRLNEMERKRAPSIYESLVYIKSNLHLNQPGELIEDVVRFLESKGFKTDYVEIADAETLTPVETWNENQKMVALIAAFNNEVRLIDNMVLN